MANTITKQTLLDGDRNLIVKVHISGDNSGDESATQLIDMSAYTADTSRAHGGRAVASLSIMRVEGNLEGFSAVLLWDATADVKAINIPAGDVDLDYRDVGGIPNNAGAGVTGDIMLTTVGLGTEEGSFTLYLRKKY